MVSISQILSTLRDKFEKLMGGIGDQALTMTEGDQAKKSGKAAPHNKNLDILRGVAALIVVLRHLVNAFPNSFDRAYNICGYISYNFPAHLAVLIFFILSGYVIGINTKRLDDKAKIRDYLKKRFVRIVPIYFITMFFTIALTFGKYGWQKILCNLFFISVPFNNVIEENNPLWSLNFELLYYLVFVAFSYFDINLVKTVKALLIIIALLFLFFHNVAVHPLFLSYLVGFLFWITGAMIAKSKWKPWNISASRIASVFLLIFCVQPFNPYGPIIKILKIPMADYSGYSLFHTSILYPELYFYALAAALIFVLTKSYSRAGLLLVYFLFLSAGVRALMIYKLYGWNFLVQEHYVTPLVILAISILMWVLNFPISGRLKRLIVLSASLSSISYAIYILHMPLLYFFGSMPAASFPYFLVKMAGYFVVLFLLSYFLELKFQPFIKKVLMKKKPAAPAL